MHSIFICRSGGRRLIGGLCLALLGLACTQTDPETQSGDVDPRPRNDGATGTTIDGGNPFPSLPVDARTDESDRQRDGGPTTDSGDQQLDGDGGLRPGVDAMIPECADGADNDGDGYTDLVDPGCDDSEDDDEQDVIVVPQCADGIDNDADGDIDLEDSDCVTAIDPTENGLDEITACANHVDDDSDGFTDFPADPGCRAAGDNDEVDPPVSPACNNGRDDDEDGRIDYPLDPGCAGRGDVDETDSDPPPACANGIDDDDNGAVDFPDDPGCVSAGDRNESGSCGDAHEVVDLNGALQPSPDGGPGFYDGNTADGAASFVGSCGGNAGPERVLAYRVEHPLEALEIRTDYPETTHSTVLYVRQICQMPADLACNRGSDESPGTQVRLTEPAAGLYYIFVDTGSREGSGAFRLTVREIAAPACRDTADNDADGLIDLADPGCTGLEDPDEADPDDPPQCADGIDNDEDGLTDYPADRDCSAAGGDRERPACDQPIPMFEIGQAGGSVNLAPDLVADYAEASCGRIDMTGETVIALSLDQPSNVVVTVQGAEGPADVTVFVRQDCNLAQSELVCDRSSVSIRALDPGEYFIFIEPRSFETLGMWSANVVVESLIRECNDELDNDGDERIDAADPGCRNGLDNDEGDPPTPPDCADGVDNDADGRVDWPDDDGCEAAGDTTEEVQCLAVDDVIEIGQEGGLVPIDTRNRANVYRGTCGGGGPEQVVALVLEVPAEVIVETTNADYDTLMFMRSGCDDPDSQIGCNDDGGQGLMSRIDAGRLEPGTYYIFVDGFGARAGVSDLSIQTELLRPPACIDEVDNDGDERIDAADPGCAGGFDDDETDPDPPPVCSNGEDDDGDGAIDWPDDADCRVAGGTTEFPRCAMDVPIVEVGQEGGLFELTPEPLGRSQTHGSCGATDSLEIVLAVTLDDPSNVNVDVTGPDGEPAALLYARRECDDPASEIACRSDRQIGGVQIRNAQAGTYFVFVEPSEGFDLLTAAVEIESLVRACNDEIDNDEDGHADLADPGCEDWLDDDETDPDLPPVCADGLDNDEDGAIDWPDDDDCGAAGGLFEHALCEALDDFVLINPADAEMPLNLHFDTRNRPNLYEASCGSRAGGPEHVVALWLEQPASLVATTVQATFDTVLHVRSACDDPQTQLVCNDDGGQGTMSRVGIEWLEPGIYFIFVDGFGRSSGETDLVLDVVLHPPDACADALDNDEDGLVDAADPGCVGSFDDDENDPDELPICANLQDDDGDGAIDWPDDVDCAAAGGVTEAHRCELAVPIIEVDQAGGVFAFPSRPGANLTQGSCGPGTGPETVLALTLTDPSDVLVEVLDPFGEPSAVVYGRGDCDDADGEIDCRADGRPLRLWALDRGTYYVFIQRGLNRPLEPLTATVTVESRVQACNDLVDNDEDGRIDAEDPGCADRFDDDESDPDSPPQCADGVDNDEDGWVDWPDDPECPLAGDPLEQHRCDGPESVIEVGQAGGEHPISLRTGVDPIDASCGPGHGRPQVLALTLDELSDLNVDMEWPDGPVPVLLSVRTDCDQPDSELACVAGSNRRLLSLASLEAGTYFLLFEQASDGPDPLDVVVTVDVTGLVTECNDALDNDEDERIDIADPGCADGWDDDETDPEELPECADGIDNDEDGTIDWPDDPGCGGAGDGREAVLCEGADDVIEVGAQGGLVAVSTVDNPNQYQTGCGGGGTGPEQVVALTLDAPARVDLHVVDASYDTVLFVRAQCDDQASELACDDDGGAGRLMSRIGFDRLEPGTYFIFVDGFAGRSGDADLQIDVEPL